MMRARRPAGASRPASPDPADSPGPDSCSGRFRARRFSLLFPALALLLGALSLFANAPAGAQVSTRTYTLTPAATAAEGSNAELTVTLGEAAPSGGLAFVVSYDYSVSGATTVDTGTTPSTVTVASGSTTATLSVPITADRAWDNGETFTVTIAPASGVSGWSVAAGGTATATVTITDGAASVTFNQAAYRFFETDGSRLVSYHAQALSYVGYSIGRLTSADGTASGGGVDYRFVEQNFEFNPFTSVCQPRSICGPEIEPLNYRSADRTLSVVVTNDDLVEDDETFTIALTPPTGWSAQPHGTATVTITDDDRAVAKIAFGSRAGAQAKYTASVDEDVTGGTLDVPVTVNRLPGSSTTFEIEVLATGTATEGSRLPHRHEVGDVRPHGQQQDEEPQRRHHERPEFGARRDDRAQDRRRGPSQG